ncbi:uncharacterized protein LOC128893747 [Hylaeus anthracinus]|uniref:uncharacterized protein LOC128893747 n=1 Tax=Hylaeus anthracinus TaxID=313031 RepID=UPI0023B93DBB|nr:uncharacterized protein LOC128893747 [Hylaeus anthracinus]
MFPGSIYELPRKRTDLPQSRIRLRAARCSSGSIGKMVPHASLLLLSGMLLGSFIPWAEAAPARYDQQQTAKRDNWQATLENFIFLVIDGGGSGKFTHTMKEAVSNIAMSALKPTREDAEEPEDSEESSGSMVYETEEKYEGKEPYHVEIVHLEKGEKTRSKRPEKLGSSEVNSEGRVKIETPLNSLEGEPNPEVSIDVRNSEKKTRSLGGSEESRGLVNGPREDHGNPTHIKYSTVDNLAQSDDLTVREEVAKATRPGMSLKKQLSEKEEKDASLKSNEGNELVNKSQELVLLGGGIENCGPGRFRDKSGICQNDANFY